MCWCSTSLLDQQAVLNAITGFRSNETQISSRQVTLTLTFTFTHGCSTLEPNWVSNSWSSTISPPQPLSLQLRGGISGSERRPSHEGPGAPPLLVQSKASTVQRWRDRDSPGPGALQRVAVRAHWEQPVVRTPWSARRGWRGWVSEKLRIFQCWSGPGAFVSLILRSQGWFPAAYVAPFDDVSHPSPARWGFLSLKQLSATSKNTRSNVWLLFFSPGLTL